MKVSAALEHHFRLYPIADADPMKVVATQHTMSIRAGDEVVLMATATKGKFITDQGTEFWTTPENDWQCQVDEFFEMPVVEEDEDDDWLF